MDIAKMTNINEVAAYRDAQELTDPKWHAAEARLRQLLMKKYGKEDALCIKEGFMPSYIKLGFVKAQDTKQADNLARIAEFVPRAYCEYNPLYKQIIPYIIGKTPSGKIFTMERIEGDARLVGKISLGIGGHIEKVDDGADVIKAGLQRELNEEVRNFKGATLSLEGFIYDPSNNVGLDHIGFVFFLNLKDESIEMKEVDKMKGYLSTVDELDAKIDRMENWSAIVYNNLLK